VRRALSRLVDFGLYAAIAVIGYQFISQKMSGPSEGKHAAPIDLPLIDAAGGERFRLSDHAGKAVLVDVFASWCSACRRSAPHLVEAFNEFGKDKVTFVGISLDGSAMAATRAKREWGLPYAVALDDGHVSKSYGIEVLPTLVLIDRAGVVRRVETGAASASQLKRWLAELTP
jgi:thiol-disulfide isomerase/thioredoxin